MSWHLPRLGDPTLLPPRAPRGLLSACSHSAAPVHMHAARCPVPAASDDVVLIPELPSPGMLMTDGTHGATGITVIDGRLILLRPPVAVVTPPGVTFSLHAAAACGLQPTSVSALSSRATGPHVWRHRSRPSPTALAAAGPDSACGPDIAGFQPGNAGLSPEDCAGFYSGSSE